MNNREEIKRIKKIKETGFCDYNCKDCKLSNLCNALIDEPKNNIAKIYLR